MRRCCTEKHNNGLGQNVLAWNQCLAKSSPPKSIKQHALECAAVYEALRKVCQFSESLLPPETIFCALSHDCGKISPGFTWEISSEIAQKNRILRPPRKVRHELISESSIKNFDYSSPVLEEYASITGWHHGFHVLNLSQETALDFGGKEWSNERKNFLKWAWKYIDHDLPKLSNRSQLLSAGILCLADWISSDDSFYSDTIQENMLELEEQCQERVKTAWDVLSNIGIHFPDFQEGMHFDDIFPFSPNEAQKLMAHSITRPGIYLLENSTGSGKTEAALFVAYQLIARKINRGIFFALPTQLTSNKIYQRVELFLQKVSPDSMLRLIHGAAWLETAGKGEFAPGQDWFSPAKRALIAPFGVGTVDQLLKGVLNVRHFFVRLAGLAGKVVIVDEVHAFDPYMHYLLVQTCRILRDLECTVILLSATLPEARRRELVGIHPTVTSDYPRLSINNEKEQCEITFPVQQQRFINALPITEDKIIDTAIESARKGANTAVIMNTVGEAQQIFQAIRAKLCGNDISVGLLHSRFPKWRRDAIENDWL